MNTKAPPFKQWNVPDPERKLGKLDSWTENHGNLGVGLVLGSPFKDGTKLAAVDVDRDNYISVTEALLKKPPCGPWRRCRRNLVASGARAPFSDGRRGL